MPIYDIRPLAEYVALATSTERFTMLLVTTFAAVAILLAIVGVYGAMAYAVTRRRREFGVRIAVGARPGQVIGLVIREGAVLAGIGVAFGTAAALATGELLRSQLLGVMPHDPITYGLAILLLVGFALLACWIPARRALACDLLRIHKAMIAEGHKNNEITSPIVTPLRDRYLGDFKTISRVLLGGVAVVLLIACVNIAALMLVRGAARAREMAIRTAIGASTARIVVQLLDRLRAFPGLMAAGDTSSAPFGGQWGEGIGS